MAVGIVSIGSYLPRFAVDSALIAKANAADDSYLGLGVVRKTIPDWDEDTATLAVAAILDSWHSLPSSQLKKKIVPQIGCLFIGSESHPYAVKPTGTMVAAALGLPSTLALADLQFACKAGTQGLQAALMYVQAGQIGYGLAVGADTAQAAAGDALEYTAAAGGAAALVGSKNLIARLEATVSVANDIPDFWRRPGQATPQHAGRFTGEPAYFRQVAAATKLLLSKLEAKPTDFTHVIFHTPNAKFPQLVAAQLGFSPQQLKHSLPVQQIGNTYAGAALLALGNVLEQAKVGDRVLMTSYGSGAGADSFALVCEPALVAWQKKRQLQKITLADKISRLESISFSKYLQLRSGGHQ